MHSTGNSYAAVDLGSNSFHLVVARLEHGQLRLIDRIKDMVRLAAGVDETGQLDPDVGQRALASLARFGQRLRGIPDSNIRAVGTQALRRMSNARKFLRAAEAALGCPVDIIGGREEARLIYNGVAEGIGAQEGKRLIIDIGGGSTEIAIGEAAEPILLESLQYGCVAVTKRYFADGRIDSQIWKAARNALRADLQELVQSIHQTGWQQAIGSSGTIRAVYQVCHAAGWCEKTINREAIRLLKNRLIEDGSIERLDLAGLSERRRPVFAGGVVILDACVRDLHIDEIEVSGYALREGVLYDLLGRLEHRDPRPKTIDGLAMRYSADEKQYERVRDTALAAFEQLAEELQLDSNHRDMLEWACQTHEIGLSIAHSSYQQHSAYLIKNSDMAGFSMQEQQLIATLVRFHRRAIDSDYNQRLPKRLQMTAARLLLLLRLAVILCRSREDAALPDFMLAFDDQILNLAFPGEWMMAHPLTMNDLDEEIIQARLLGFELQISQLTLEQQPPARQPS